MKKRNDAHLSDTRAWFIFRASARNLAPLEPMLLFRRLNYKYLVIKHNLDGATVEMINISEYAINFTWTPNQSISMMIVCYVLCVWRNPADFSIFSSGSE